MQDLSGYKWEQLKGQLLPSAIFSPTTDFSSLKAFLKDPDSPCLLATHCFKKDGTPFFGLLIRSWILRPWSLSEAHESSDKKSPGTLNEQRRDCIMLVLRDVTAKVTRIGSYCLGRLLGKGAFGSVYLGKKRETGKHLWQSTFHG